MYEVDADGVEEVSLELVFLRGGAVTENLMSRQDLPTPLLPMMSVLRVQVLSEVHLTNLRASTCRLPH